MAIGDILGIVPQFGFQRGLGAILDVSSVTDDENLRWSDVWSFEARVWLPLVLMCFVGTLEWIYVYRLTTGRDNKTVLKAEEAVAAAPIDVSRDPDISEERQRGLRDDEGINARDLVKVFKIKPDKDAKSKEPIIKRAVKGMSCGIRRNEIYALLGPNGSGKSVTMSMMAGKYTPDNGAVALDGNVATENDRGIDHLYKKCNIAYCRKYPSAAPSRLYKLLAHLLSLAAQFDALFPKKTVLEHMKFYAAIRGLDWEEEAAQDHVNSIVKLLGLTKHLNKESTELSGGYKRRLSMGIALIGYPNVLIVDECTTGVDPGARRRIWDVLKPPTTHGDFDIPATILSSHYMDECQELGTRIGILIDGKIVATGSLKRLNELFCTSFFVEISLEPNAAEDAEEKIIEMFNSKMAAESYESLPYRCKLKVPFLDDGKDTTKQLADIFDLLESNKESAGIKFYSVAPMNLEQIFIDLSRKQFDVNADFTSMRSL